MGSVKTRQLERLAEAKQASAAQLLLKCARLLNEEAMRRVNAGGRGLVMRPAHAALIPHIEFEGSRITDIAGRAGVTKQAVGQVVDEMEQEGLVERLPDPHDRRAKLVRFTGRGAEAIFYGLSVLGEIERELEREVGRTHVRALSAALSAILPVLEGMQPSDEQR